MVAVMAGTNTHTIEWQEWRCRYCGRKLAEVALVEGSVSILCERCKKINTLAEGKKVGKSTTE